MVKLQFLNGYQGQKIRIFKFEILKQEDREMNRLTKRNSKGIAYMAVADTLFKENQEIESSKP